MTCARPLGGRSRCYRQPELDRPGGLESRLAEVYFAVQVSAVTSCTGHLTLGADRSLIHGAMLPRPLEVVDHGHTHLGSVSGNVAEAQTEPRSVRGVVVGFRGEEEAPASPERALAVNFFHERPRDPLTAVAGVRHHVLQVDL